MNQPTKSQIIKFLKQSNAIENVYGEKPLMHALEAWDWLMQQNNMTGQVIRKVHKLLSPDGLKEAEIGHYRKCPVWIAGEETIPHQRISEHLKEWCQDMNRIGRSSIPDNEMDAKNLHVCYEKIHPFVDGNGRTGRMFMNWHRIKKLDLSLLIIQANLRWEYYRWFNL